MNKNIDLIYFSGTGNSREVATELADVLENCSVRLFDGAIVLKNSSYTPVAQGVTGLVFPLYFGAAPKSVFLFLEKCFKAGSLHLFLIVTNGLPYRFFIQSVNPLIHVIEKKGGNVFAVYQVAMPIQMSGFFEYPDVFSNRLLHEMKRRVKKIGSYVVRGRSFPYKLTMAGSAFSRLGQFVQLLLRMYGLGLEVTGACEQCGLCIRGCPVSAIVMDRGVRFSSGCILCMRCICSCPVSAIKPRRLKRFFSYPLYKLSSESRMEDNNSKISRKWSFFEKTISGYFNEDL
ncbi:MAG: EFR1 family ferrodoxin [Spirochaetes bacterium]|jgi:ferredoxin|nr:EFR1 family ferrodoxin [Spirochaetota bacterium]